MNVQSLDHVETIQVEIIEVGDREFSVIEYDNVLHTTEDILDHSYPEGTEIKCGIRSRWGAGIRSDHHPGSNRYEFEIVR